YATIIDIKSQSGFSWDDVLGANISPADASRWSAFTKMHPDVKLFHNKGWERFHKMDKLM
ncbi:hypothetical protein BDR07DRAFT_1256444, partial [Suillus spraguei]